MINSTAIILAGGKSSRMKTNKLLLEVDGKPLVKIISDLCQDVFEETILITNTPEDYECLKLKTYKDIFSNYGPLSGVHSGLIHSGSEKNFIVSADMPFINKKLIEFLFEVNSQKQIILPKSNNRVHLLSGIYKKNILPVAEKLLLQAEKKNMQKENNKTKIKLHDLINSVDTDIIEVSKEIFFNENLFFNMNTLDDYNFVKEIFNKNVK